MEQPFNPKVPGSLDIDEKIVALTRGKRVAVPPYPAVALRLHEVANRAQFSINDVVDVVSADQALTATVLRSANSAVFSAMGAATTLQQAVQRLGASEVARLALAAGLAESMKVPGALQTLRRQAWAEGVSCAAVSNALARLRGLSQRDAFVAGLLHDFARIVGIACLEQVLLANPAVAARSEAEWRASLDRVVPELGALVASTWNLPPLLQQSMILRDPKAWAKSPNAPLLEVIAIADTVVALMMQSPHVSADDLAYVVGLRSVEREQLADVLPTVPLTIAAFESEQTQKPLPSKLALPSTMLGNEPLRALALPLVQSQPSRRGPFQMVGINNMGWSMLGEQGLPERQVFEATIYTNGVVPPPAKIANQAPGAQPPGLKMWASTLCSIAEDGGFRIECKPFALDRDGKRRWADLVHAAAK